PVETADIPKNWIPPELEPLIDPASRIEIETFIKKLGARVTDIVPHGAPDPVLPASATSWEKWNRRRLDRIFRVGQQHTSALNKAEEQNRRYWWRAQHEAAKTWTAWEAYWRKNPGMANLWRRDHKDETGDWRWMLQFAEPRDEEGR